MQKGIFYTSKGHVLQYKRASFTWQKSTFYFSVMNLSYKGRMLSGVHFNPTSYPSYIIMVYRALFVRPWKTRECVLFIHFECPFQRLCDALSLSIIKGQERLNSLLFQVDYLTYSGPVLLNPAHEKLRTINLFHYHSVGSFCHTVLFISGFPIDCTVIQILNIGCKSRVEERCLMSYKRDIMVLCIAFVLFAAASWCQKS